MGLLNKSSFIKGKQSRPANELHDLIVFLNWNIYKENTMFKNFKLIWKSNSSDDAKIVFGNIEVEPPGSIYSVYIPEIKKSAWQYLRAYCKYKQIYF